MHQSNACFCINISMLRILTARSDPYLMPQQIDSEVPGTDTRRVGVFGKHEYIIRGQELI